MGVNSFNMGVKGVIFMRLSTDYSGSRMSVFVCDRCQTKIVGDERVTVRAYRPKQQTIIKKWDLCRVCYRKLYRGIEKYKDKLE